MLLSGYENSDQGSNDLAPAPAVESGLQISHVDTGSPLAGSEPQSNQESVLEQKVPSKQTSSTTNEAKEVKEVLIDVRARSSSMSEENVESLDAAFLYQNVIEGISIWPVLYYTTILTHDLWYYFNFPTLRYGIDLKDIFFSYPIARYDSFLKFEERPSEFIWSNCPLVDNPQYASWIITGVSLIVLRPLVQGLIMFLKNKNEWNKFQEEKDIHNMIREIEAAGSQLSCFRFWLCSVQKHPGMLARLAFSLTYDLENSEEVRNLQLKYLIHLAKNNSLLVSLTAISHLENFVKHNQRLGKKLKKQGYEGLSKEIKAANDELKKISFYKKLKYYPIFSVILMFLAVESYLNLTMWIIQNVIEEWKLYPEAKSTCEAMGRVYGHIQDLTINICSLCGDLGEFSISLAQMNSPQACLSAVLSLQVSGAEILNKIQRLINRIIVSGTNDISEIDLSKTSWDKWSDSDFIEIIGNISLINAKILHLSASLPSLPQNDISSKKVEAIAQVINNYSLSQLSLINQKIFRGDRFNLLQAIKNSSISTLKVVNTEMGNEGAQEMSRLLPNSIDTLVLDSIGMSHQGLDYILPELKRLSVANLNLDNNKDIISKSSLFISNYLSGIKKLSLSGVGRIPANWFKMLGSNPQAFNGTIIEFSKANIDSEILYAWSPQQIQKSYGGINLANNDLTHSGAVAAWLNSLSKTMSYLNLSNTRLEDNSFEELSNYIAGSALKVLIIDNNPIASVSIWQRLINTILQSSIEYVDLSSMEIDSEKADILNQALIANPTHRLRYILLAHNNIANSAPELISTFSRLNIVGCDLSDTHLSSNAIQTIEETLKNSSFQTIILDDNSDIPSQGVVNIINAASNTCLNQFSFKNVNVDSDDFVNAFAEGSWGADLSILGNEQLSKDQERLSLSIKSGIRGLGISQSTAEIKRIMMRINRQEIVHEVEPLQSLVPRILGNSLYDNNTQSSCSSPLSLQLNGPAGPVLSVVFWIGMIMALGALMCSRRFIYPRLPRYRANHFKPQQSNIITIPVQANDNVQKEHGVEFATKNNIL